jgi:hypothetical protein
MDIRLLFGKSLLAILCSTHISIPVSCGSFSIGNRPMFLLSKSPEHYWLHVLLYSINEMIVFSLKCETMCRLWPRQRDCYE